MGMGRSTGLLSRFLINYEICLAYMIADSVNLDADEQRARCPFNPFRIVSYRDNPQILDYFSVLNYILAYHKSLDDIMDDRSLKARTAERLMRRKYIRIASEYGEAIEVVEDQLARLSEREIANGYLPIAEAAEPFGDLLGGVMRNCLDDMEDSLIFSILCKYIGRWIYVLDAVSDLKQDYQNGNYNALLAGTGKSFKEVWQDRSHETISFLSESQNTMYQLLELLSCAKNKDLIYSAFQHLLPPIVAKSVSHFAGSGGK